MKRLNYTILFNLLFISFTSAQNNDTLKKEVHALQTKSSFIHWKGYYLFNISEHNGTVSFSEGNLITTNGHITGGDFLIDMKSITN